MQLKFFCFVIIMSNFAVPKQIQKYVLSVGITIALIFRGLFILIGAALITRFTWVFFIFGAFLIYTALKLVLGGDEDEEYHENGIIRALRKVIKITDDYDGEKLRTTKNGVRYWTPMLQARTARIYRPEKPAIAWSARHVTFPRRDLYCNETGYQ